MSNSDFNDRLDRIKSGKPKGPLQPSGGEGKRAHRPGRFAVACGVFAVGLQAIKAANTQYEAIRDQYGIPAAAGVGLGSIGLVILGIVLMFVAFGPARGATPMPAPTLTVAPRQKVQVSTGARAFFSLLGLGLGALACFFMFVGNAAFQLSVVGQISVETSRAMATGCSVAAGLLALVALVIGFVGLFVPGLPMKRVPLLYPLGAVLLFASFYTFRIHPVDWPVFMVEFTRSFTNQIAE